MNTVKVVVIGAGPAGIAASTKLLELGFENVIIVKAENRIGGRINTVPFANNVIDLGAQWCHGEKGNVVYELARQHNLLESSGDAHEEYECIRSNKEVLPTQVADRLKGFISNSKEIAKKELRNYDGSLGSYFATKYYEDVRKTENSDIDAAIANEFFKHFQKMENSAEASDSLNDVSGKGYFEYWECEGDMLLNWKGKGYREFLRLLMKSAEKGSELGVLDQRVLLMKPVKRVNWNNSDAKKVQVKCEDGEVIEADHVIVTVSLGVLKEKHMQMFEPKLPVEKVRAIDGIGFGTVNKIFLEFATQFWPSDWNGCGLLWREQDVTEIRGTDRAWLEDVFFFGRVQHQPNVLIGWIVGPHGRHMETLAEEEIRDGCMYLLRKFLKYDIPTPVNFKTSAWFKNEHFRGSYSFRSMLTEKLNTRASDLVSPLTNCDQKPVLMFAGEASSEHHYSTVHGAVETGWREAQRLAKFYENTRLM